MLKLEEVDIDKVLVQRFDAMNSFDGSCKNVTMVGFKYLGRVVVGVSCRNKLDKYDKNIGKLVAMRYAMHNSESDVVYKGRFVKHVDVEFFINRCKKYFRTEYIQGVTNPQIVNRTRRKSK